MAKNENFFVKTREKSWIICLKQKLMAWGLKEKGNFYMVFPQITNKVGIREVLSKKLKLGVF